MNVSETLFPVLSEGKNMESKYFTHNTLIDSKVIISRTIPGHFPKNSHFQDKFQDRKNSRTFPGLPGLPGQSGHPDITNNVVSNIQHLENKMGPVARRITVLGNSKKVITFIGTPFH